MPSKRNIELCRYHYDALDRLANRAPVDQPPSQCFYNRNRLATEIQGHVQRSMFERGRSILAQTRRIDDEVETLLSATDLPGSVLQTVGVEESQSSAYMPYGHQCATDGLVSVLAFNGERPDPVTGHYLLGNGYRAFNPVLMRFNSPDSFSPFGKGGLNPYAYCVGDPVNKGDSNGHMPSNFLKNLHHMLRSIEAEDLSEELWTNQWNFARFKNKATPPSLSLYDSLMRRTEEIFGAIPGSQIEASYGGPVDEAFIIWDRKTKLYNIEQHVEHRRDVSVYDVISAGVKGKLNGVLPVRANDLSVLISEGQHNTGDEAFKVIKKGTKRKFPLIINQARQNEIYRQAGVPLPEAFRIQSFNLTISIEEAAENIRFNTIST